MAPPRKKASAPKDTTVTAGAVNMARRVSALNRWRAQYNPLRGLTLARAVNLLEAHPQGIMADLQWTNLFIEGTDADLLALVDRRTSAITEMDYDALIVPKTKQRPATFDQKLADEQRAALQEAYDRVENLYELFGHLLLAKFRGYAHAEKARTVAGDVVRFEIVDQWNVVRDGFNGDWKYNPEAQNTTFEALPADNIIPAEDFIIRVAPRPIDRIALIKFIRTNLGQKDWDAFVEIFGMDPVIITGPPNVPAENEAEYESAAREVAEGGSGYLPHGSTAEFANAQRGVSPFRDYLEYLSEKLILAGTGGMLTMLARSGTGTLAGEAHTETFQMIAKNDARSISEVLQTQFDKPLLARLFPGKPILAYFALAQNEETDPKQVVEDAAKLKTAGFKLDASEFSEKTGYNLQDAPDPAADPNAGPEKKKAIEAAAKAKADLKNKLAGKSPEEKKAFMNSREGRDLALVILNAAGFVESSPSSDADELVAAAAPEYAAARLRGLQPIARAVAMVLRGDDTTGPVALRELATRLPDLARTVLKNPPTVPILADTQTAGFFNGIGEAAHQRHAIA